MQTDYFWFVLATIIGVFKMWLTAYRCCYLITGDNRLSITNSFYYYTVGMMANMVLPFRAGDIVRTSMLAKSLNVSKSKILGTIASEHIIDFSILCFLLIACLGLYSYQWPSQILPTIIIIIFITTLVITGITLSNSKSANLLKNVIITYLPTKLTFITNLIANFYSGFLRLGSLFNIIKILTITALIWIAQGLWVYALLCSLGFIESYQLGLEVVLVLLVMMGIAVMIPASPGYIGTFHLMIVLGLTQMNVTKSASLSYAILAHAHTLVFAILIGLISLWRINLKSIQPMMH